MNENKPNPNQPKGNPKNPQTTKPAGNNPPKTNKGGCC